MVLVPLTFVFDPTAPLGSVDALYMNPALIAALSNSGQPPPNTEFAALGSRTGLIAYLTPAQIEALLLPPVAHRIVRPIDPRDPGGVSRLLAGFVWPDGGICLEPTPPRGHTDSEWPESISSGVVHHPLGPFWRLVDTIVRSIELPVPTLGLCGRCGGPGEPPIPPPPSAMERRLTKTVDSPGAKLEWEEIRSRVVDLNDKERRESHTEHVPDPGAALTGEGVRAVLVDTGFCSWTVERLEVDSKNQVVVREPIAFEPLPAGAGIPSVTVTVAAPGKAPSGTHAKVRFEVLDHRTLQLHAPSGANLAGTEVDVAYSFFEQPLLRRFTASTKLSARSSNQVLSPYGDDDGHGTLVAWAILQVAPGVELESVRYTDASMVRPWAKEAFVSTVQRLVLQRQQNDEAGRPTPPTLIVCPWVVLESCDPWSLRLAIELAVEHDIVVLFAAGNGHTDATCPQSVAHPDVISVGGATVPMQHADLTRLRRSSLSAAPAPAGYASGYESVHYASRACPDVVSLFGPFDDMPTQRRSIADQVSGVFPVSDGDGRVTDEGTSLSVGFTAGVVAQLLEKYSRRAPPVRLIPNAVHNVLENAADDITGGVGFGGPGAVGWDLATGWGFARSPGVLEHLQPGPRPFLRSRLRSSDPTYRSPDVWVTGPVPPTPRGASPFDFYGLWTKHRRPPDLHVRASGCAPLQYAHVWLRLQNWGEDESDPVLCVYAVWHSGRDHLSQRVWSGSVSGLIVASRTGRLLPGEFRVVRVPGLGSVAAPPFRPTHLSIVAFIPCPAHVGPWGHARLASLVEKSESKFSAALTLRARGQTREQVIAANVAWRRMEVTDA